MSGPDGAIHSSPGSPLGAASPDKRGTPGGEPARPAPLSAPAAAFRWVEMVAFFFIGPVAGAMLFHPRHALGVLVLLTVAALVMLLTDPSFDRRCLWNWAGARRVLPGVLLRWFYLMGALSAVMVGYLPERFLSFPRERPEVWAVVMCLYPVFSVYPQELVWRVFFHHRYAPLLPGRAGLIIASAAAFGVMHVIFRNWPAVALTLIGGALFAWTYERSRSAAAVWVEHALYGCGVFTIGLGVYFYGGAVR